MTTKEHLHRLVDELSEQEARHARIVVEDQLLIEQREREIDRAIVEGYTRVPPGGVDEWGSLREQTKALAEQTAARLETAEIARAPTSPAAPPRAGRCGA